MSNWTQAQDVELKARYGAGEPWKILSRDFDRSHNWLNQRVRSLGCAKRDAKNGKGYQQKWENQKDELIELVGLGLDNQEIAARLGRTVDGVRHMRAHFGLSSEAAPRLKLRDDARRARKQKWADTLAGRAALRLRVRKAVERGENPKTVAETESVHCTGIYKLAQEMGLHFYPRCRFCGRRQYSYDYDRCARCY